MQPVQQWSDSFGNQKVRGTKSRIDIPSPYGFNTERLKKIVQGNVDATAQFNETGGHFELSTTGATDDAFRLESHERLRYTPGYELEVGIACRFPQDLQDGDRVILGVSDNDLPSDDGLQFVFDGPNTTKCRIRGGGNTRREIDAELPPDFDPTNPFIARIIYNLYGVGTCRFDLTYTVKDTARNGDTQKNRTIAELSVNDDWTVDEFTLHIISEINVQDSTNTSGSTLEVGSMQGILKGNVDATRRFKSINGFGLGGSINSTSWTPIKAYRIDPGRDNVFIQLQTIEASPSDTMKIAAYAVDTSSTDASSFSTGAEALSGNSVIQTSTSVTTPTSPTKRQIGMISATGGNKNAAQNQTQQVDTPLYDDEICVLLARTKSASNASTDIVTRWLEEW